MEAEIALTSDGFSTVLTEHLRSEIKVYPSRAHHPSQLGHPCARFLTWRATRWQEQTPHNETLQSIFDQGRDHQPIIYRRLEALGYEIVRESDRPIEYRTRGGAVISGTPDGRIIGFRGSKISPARICEIKTMAEHSWSGIETIADIRDNEAHYLRGYYSQGNVYAFLENLPGGVFVLENKATGLLKMIPYELDYEHAEACLQKIEAIQQLIDSGADPEPIPFNWKVCGSCGFRNICYAPIDFGKGASVIDDDFLIGKLRRREELATSSAEYARLDKEIKEQLKYQGIEHAIAGDFVIEGSKRHRKAYSVNETDYVQFTIEKMTPKPTDG